MAERKYNYESSPIVISLENEIDNDADSFSIVLADASDKLSLTLNEIKRNYLYQIFVEYGGDDESEGEVVSGYKIMDWDIVYPDGDLGGVILAVDNVIAMDWFRNGYSYTSTAVAFGGDRDIEIMLPLERYDDGTYLYCSDYDNSSVYLSSTSRYYSLNLLGYTTYDDLSTLGWLTSARMTSSSHQGYLTFTYVPMDVSYENETFPIRFRSENVYKTLKVIYDNGYVSQNNIPTEGEKAALTAMYNIGFDWIDGITNGFVSAKRGEYLHPAVVEDVIYAEEVGGDNLYIGEAVVTYNDGVVTDSTGTELDPMKYCKTLGLDWYLPSVDMLRMVQLRGKELGTSYRLQNSDDTYYLGWSGSYDGTITYQAVPMDKRWTSDINRYWESNLVPQPVVNGAQYQIRCLLNM